MQFPRVALLTALALAVCPASSALATYSIVAVDTRTREVGGAGASCVYPNQVSVIFGVAPGFGAVHAQAQSNAAGRDRAVQLLALGQAPQDIIAAITAASFDNIAARRQYGVVDVMGRSAGYTGTQNMMFADDVQGSTQGYVYSVQGNILTGPAVLMQAASAFEGEGCDLPERLLRALEAGAKNGEGDTRCTGPSSIAANSAFLQVDLPGMPAGSYLKLSAGSGRGVDPLPPLRMAFERWRSTHPCAAGDAGSVFDAGAMQEAGTPDAALPRDAAVAASDAGDPVPVRDAASIGSDAASFDAALPGANPAPGSALDAGLSEAGAPKPVGSESAASEASEASEASDESGGCSTSPASNPGTGLGFLLLALTGLMRRSRTRLRR